MTPTADAERLTLAQAFLQEAVYRSRGDQAGATLLAAGSASCGLGEKPAVALDLSPRAEEIYAELFGEGDVDLDAMRACLAGWVKRQDALDRTRNHFLKDFRNAHGMDRRDYSPEELQAYEAGLERINSQVADEREAAAAKLLELA